MNIASDARIPGLSYVLPIKRSTVGDCDELTAYLRWLAQHVEVVVVDGSPPDVFAHHQALWIDVRHVAPAPELRSSNGKAWGANTGLRLATHERVIIADDDVRYDLTALHRMRAMLDEVDLVRPQNYFEPAPWHACWDTGRTLLNRALGGDWPGTLGVRRSRLLAVGGYAGDVLFENLELCRTVEAAGGSTEVPLDLYVRRLPPTASHFWSQRVRQAYDEFARPVHLVAELALLPVVTWILVRRRFGLIAAMATVTAIVAEFGRRRAGGRRYFPVLGSLMAPLWLLERAVCAWLAVATRLRHGGVRYGETVLANAATPPSVLRERLQERAN